MTDSLYDHGAVVVAWIRTALHEALRCAPTKVPRGEDIAHEVSINVPLVPSARVIERSQEGERERHLSCPSLNTVWQCTMQLLTNAPLLPPLACAE